VFDNEFHPPILTIVTKVVEKFAWYVFLPLNLTPVK